MKKNIILVLAAIMTFSVSSSYVAAAEMTESSVLTDNKKPSKKKGEIKEVTFKVHLHCANCVKKVQENIAFEKGVKGLHVCLEDQIVELKYDSSKTSEDALKAAIEKLGYKILDEAHDHHHHN